MALYFRLVAASIRARMQYKLDFIITFVLYALLTAVDFLFVATVLYRYRYIMGWNVYEVALLSGVASSAFGLYRTFGAELNSFERYLVNGDFDSLLIRPWPTLATLLSRSFDMGRLGGVGQGIILITVGLNGVLDAGAPPWLAVYVYLLPIAGTGVIMALSLATATAGFWLTRIDELQVFAIGAPFTASTYPLDIFPKWLRWLFTGLLPVATMGYIPLRYALGKGGTVLALATPFAAAGLSLLVGLHLWRWGERHYQSTGN